MIVTDKFIWVHVPRTAGSLMREFLRKKSEKKGNFTHYIEANWHASIDCARFAWRNCQGPWPASRFAIIRNPWEWTVSMFTFWKQHFDNKTGGYARAEYVWTPDERYHACLFQQAQENGLDSFRHWLVNLYHDGRGLWNTVKNLTTLSDLPGGDKVCALYRYEGMPGGFWSRLGLPWWDESFARLWETERINSSSGIVGAARKDWIRGHFEGKEDLVDMIRERDDPLIIQGKYSLPW